MSFTYKANRYVSRMVATVNSVYALENLLVANRNYQPPHDKICYADQFKLQLSRADWVRNCSGSFLGNMDKLLESLPQDEPITNSTVWALLISYFGNSAKKKLRELSTPKAILLWLFEDPMAVALEMKIELLPTRTKEEFDAYKKRNGFIVTEEDIGVDMVPTPEPAPKRVRRVAAPPLYAPDIQEAINSINTAPANWTVGGGDVLGGQVSTGYTTTVRYVDPTPAQFPVTAL